MNSFHSAIGYLAFEKLGASVSVFFEKNSPSFLGYSQEAVARRCIQRFAELALVDFLKVEAAYHATHACSSLREQRIGIAGMSLMPQTGRVAPGIRLIGRSLAEFAAHWSMVLAAHLRALFRASPDGKQPATVLIGVGKESLTGPDGDAEFVRYCMEGPITPLRDATMLIVAATDRLSSTSDHIAYARFPFLHLAASAGLSLPGFLRFLAGHLGALAAYGYAVIRFPFVATLGRDFAYHAMISRLNREGMLRDVVLSNSAYTAQPLWMVDLPERHFRTHMVWYSMNSVPFVYCWDNVRTDVPNFKYIRVDETWAWTEAFAAYLQSLGISGAFHAVGPILWYLPEISSFSAADRIRVAVFDVTPVRPELEQEFGLFYNYYSAANSKKFLEDVVRAVVVAAGGRSVDIILKHKRNHHPIHDPGYIALVEQLERDSNIELADADCNMYTLLQSCHLAIVIPYSSPAFVAASEGVPAIYFDPNEELVPRYEKSELITFASGRQELENQLTNACREFR